jgi:molybdopterin converting factor small subunit
MLASVDKVFSKDDTILFDQAEVGFFPHISGG